MKFIVPIFYAFGSEVEEIKDEERDLIVQLHDLGAEFEVRYRESDQVLPEFLQDV